MTTTNETPPVADPATDTSELDADVAAIGEEFAPEPEAPVKPVPPPPPQELVDAISGVLQITFGILVKVRGSHWALSPQEVTTASIAYAAVVHKYFPDMEIGPEAAAIAVTGMIVLPRIVADNTKKPAKPKARPAPETHDADPEPLDAFAGVDDAG